MGNTHPYRPIAAISDRNIGNWRVGGLEPQRRVPAAVRQRGVKRGNLCVEQGEIASPLLPFGRDKSDPL